MTLGPRPQVLDFVVSRTFWTNLFLSLSIISAIYGTHKKIPGGHWGSSISTLMSGFPVNGKCRCSAPDFVHMPSCMLLLSLSFSPSSELTTYSPNDKIFTFISLSLLYTRISAEDTGIKVQKFFMAYFKVPY
jgi:hypothetical protein